MTETETPIYDALTRQYGDPHIPPISLTLPSFQIGAAPFARRIRGRLPAGSAGNNESKAPSMRPAPTREITRGDEERPHS